MLRRVGLLFGAILASTALVGVMASTASAQVQVGLFVTGEESEEEAEQPRFEGEAEPTYVDADEAGVHKWEFEIGTIECEADFVISGELAGPSQEVRLGPSMFPCQSTPNSLVSVEGNGCENVFSLLNVGPPYVGQFGMACPPGFAFTFHAETIAGTCSIAIPSQAGLDEVTYENTGEGAERAVHTSIDVSGLKYTITGPEALCSPGEYENGTYSGAMTLKGFDEEF